MARKKENKKVQTPYVSLNVHTIFFFLFFFSLFTIFLLAHVYLQFTIRDLRIETARLQRQGEKMRTMEKKLIWEIGKLKQGDRLHEFALRDLGLEDVDPASIEKLEVSHHMIARYGNTGKGTGYEEAKWAEEKYPGGFKGKMGSILEINRELSAREQTLEDAWKKAKTQK